MEDYKEEIRKLLLKFYWNAGNENKLKLRTTTEVLQEVRGIIPAQPITEHDVFELLKEMDFEQDLEIIYEKKCIFEGNEAEGRAAEYDNVEVGRIFKWKFYLK